MSDYPEVLTSPSLALVDLGDGVAGLELRSKLGVISSELIEVGTSLLERLPNEFAAVVVFNQQKHFSLGANLKEISAAIENNDLDAVDTMILRGQQWMTSLRSLSIPVVNTPYGYALGGGCELTASAWASVAEAGANFGLVEANVGLVPGWGGIVEQIRSRINARSVEGSSMCTAEAKQELVVIFDRLRCATTSESAAQAKEFGFLRPDDQVIEGQENLLSAAKALALELVDQPDRRPQESELFMTGNVGLTALQKHLDVRAVEEDLSAHDVEIARHLIAVLTGGAIEPGWAPETMVRKAEREHLVELAGTTATQERITHILATGQPLRN